MTFVYYRQHIESKNKGDFYVVRLCLVDKDNKVVGQSNPIFWLTKEQFESLSTLPTL